MDDTPVPETLQTIAAKIDALIRSNNERFSTVDQRFDKVDQRFDQIDQRFAKVEERLEAHDQQFVSIDQRFKTIDQQFAETRAQLGVKIEAVDAKADKIYDELIAMREEARRNASEHKTFMSIMENHEVRILALEKPGSPNS